MAISHDGRTIATYRPASPFSEICLWNTAVGQPMVVLDRHRSENILAAAFSPDDTALAIMCDYMASWKIIVWRPTCAKRRAQRRTDRNDLSGCACDRHIKRAYLPLPSWAAVARRRDRPAPWNGSKTIGLAAGSGVVDDFGGAAAGGLPVPDGHQHVARLDHGATVLYQNQDRRKHVATISL